MKLICSSLDVGKLPPTLGTKDLQPSLGLGSQNLLFRRLRWLQSLHIQLPAATATASTDPDPDPECHYQESKIHCWTDQLQMLIKGALMRVHL